MLSIYFDIIEMFSYVRRVSDVGVWYWQVREIDLGPSGERQRVFKIGFQATRRRSLKQPSAIVMAGGAPGLIAFYIKFFKLEYTFIVFSNYNPEDIESLSEEIKNLFFPKGKHGE